MPTPPITPSPGEAPPVHPVADLFPMLAADELKALAADITERGLLHDIVLDGQGRILDGRNRHAACGIAGVTPTFTPYQGDDPAGYALAANIARRHLTKGQQAMVIARACSVSEQTVRDAASQYGVSPGYISQANVVLEYAPEWVDPVVTGACSLDEAYGLAKDRKEHAAEAGRLLDQLRDRAPDLADHVVEERMTAREAHKKWRDRENQQDQQDRQRRETATDLITSHVYIIARWRDGLAADYASRFDPAQAQLRNRPVTRQTLADARTALDQIITVFDERGLP